MSSTEDTTSTSEEPAKKGRKKLEITVLKEIIARLPKTHIVPVINIVKEYCRKNKLDACIDDNKEKKELEALCKAKNIECPKMNEMTLGQIKTMIHSIELGDIKSSKPIKRTSVKDKAKHFEAKVKVLEAKPKVEESETIEEGQEAEQQDTEQQGEQEEEQQ